jgi:hypothetical protein
LRQEPARRLRQGLATRPGEILQVEGHADHDRPPLPARLQKGIAHSHGHPLGQMQAVISGACRAHERRLVDGLIIPPRFQRRLARKDHQRNARPHGGRQGRHELGEPRPAGHGRHADMVGLAGEGHGGGDGAMLMADIDHPAAETGEPRRPVHIGIAEQGEAGFGAFLPEAAGQDVIDLVATHDAASRLAALASVRRARRGDDVLLLERRECEAKPPAQIEKEG